MSLESDLSLATFTCRLSDLAVLPKTSRQPETIVPLAEPVLVTLTVTFVGSGAIAFLPLQATIQVDFFAVALPGHTKLELGGVSLTTQPQQFTYTAALGLPSGLATVGATSSQLYTLSALVRIGAIGFPALITGIIEGLMIQTYD